MSKTSYTELYSYTKPVSDPRMFKGRTIQLENTLAGLRRSDSFSLVGGKRIGKTSFLFRTRELLREDRKVGGDLLPVYFSSQELSVREPATIFFQLFSSLHREAGSIHAPRRFATDSIDPYQHFESSLKSFYAAITRPTRLVFMIDETNALLGEPWTMNLAYNLRHLITASDLQKKVCIVLAGTSRMCDLWNVEASPLLNVLCPLQLAALEEEEALDLIRQPTGDQLPQESAGRIFEQTGGHPYLVQRLLRALCDLPGELGLVTTNLVDSLAETLAHDIFASWINEMDDRARRTYRSLAEKGGPVTRETILDYLAGEKPIEVSRSLDLLHSHGVIRPVDHASWYTNGIMFRKWFLSNVGGQGLSLLSSAPLTAEDPESRSGEDTNDEILRHVRKIDAALNPPPLQCYSGFLCARLSWPEADHATDPASPGVGPHPDHLRLVFWLQPDRPENVPYYDRVNIADGCSNDTSEVPFSIEVDSSQLDPPPSFSLRVPAKAKSVENMVIVQKPEGSAQLELWLQLYQRREFIQALHIAFDFEQVVEREARNE